MLGNTNRIFVFGHSGGGAQSAIMGTGGGSDLYTPYLESIGAASVDNNGIYISNSICGAICWCPITSLDYADELVLQQYGYVESVSLTTVWAQVHTQAER